MLYKSPNTEPNRSKPHEPTVEDHGLFAIHDQGCAVHRGHHAVLQMERGIFQPSWKAQTQGWRLIQADTWLKRTIIRLFFE